MHWFNAYGQVREYVVKIKTPSGYGTGFLITYNKTRSLMAIGTAGHVVADADEWQLPLKIVPEVSGEEAFLTHEQRVIYINALRDSAYIVMASNANRASVLR